MILFLSNTSFPSITNFQQMANDSRHNEITRSDIIRRIYDKLLLIRHSFVTREFPQDMRNVLRRLINSIKFLISNFLFIPCNGKRNFREIVKSCDFHVKRNNVTPLFRRQRTFIKIIRICRDIRLH